MNKTVKFLALSALLAAVPAVASAEGLVANGNDAEGAVINQAEIKEGTTITFGPDGVNVNDANGDVVASFPYSWLNNITFSTGPSGIGDLAADSPYSLRSNPVEDRLEILGFNGSPASVKVFDLSGALRVDLAEWQGESIDVAELPAGAYLLTVNKSTIKFIKK